MSKNAKVSLCWVAITTALLALLFVAARSRTGSGAVQLSPTTTTTIYTEQRVHTAEELDILVDPTGTPYDSGSILWGPEAVRREPLTTFVAPDGVLAVMDGNAVQVNPFGFRDGASTVTLAGERLDVFVFREFYERDGEEWSSVLGVEVSVPGTEVAAWGDVEFGYGTDGGVGGIITESASTVRRITMATPSCRPTTSSISNGSTWTASPVTTRLSSVTEPGTVVSQWSVGSIGRESSCRWLSSIRADTHGG